MTASARPRDVDRRAIDRLLAVTLVVAVAWNLIANLALPGAWYVPANLLVATGLLALARRAGLGADELGLRRDRIGRGALVGLGAAVVVATGLAVALAVPGIDSALESDAVREDSGFDHWFVPIVRIPLGTAVFEETVFRSVLLGALLCRHATPVAVAVSSVLFGLWHIVPAWETTGGGALSVTGAVVGTVAITAIAGVLFALLRLWAGSLVAPVLAHVATNSLAYVAALVALGIV